jgi:hypothetical protein
MTPTDEQPQIELVEDEDIIFEGSPLNRERVETIVSNVRAELRVKRTANLQPGRKSLTADGVQSPLVQFRVPADLRDRAAEIAAADGITLSKFGRDAFVAAVRDRSGG